MKAFFTKEEAQVLDKTQVGRHTCYSCGLYRKAKSPKMKPYGNFKKEILLIGDAPGVADDNNNKLWHGPYGRLLKGVLKSFGVDLFEDCLTINSVNCLPPDGRKPKGFEVTCCRNVKVLKAIEKYNPNVIILLGASAVESLVGHRWGGKLGGIDKWRGWTIPDRDFKAWVCPVFHPSYFKTTDNKAAVLIWKNDLKKAISLCDTKLPKFKKPKFHFIKSLEPLRKLKPGLIAFDYEATALKPHAKGNRIVCCSIATVDLDVYVFMLPDKKKERAPLIDILESMEYDKVAANMKYEDTWTFIRLKLGTIVRGWCFDTMLGAHISDNRPGISGLKFQTYIRLGVVDYNSDVDPYLKSKKKGSNELNRIDELLKKPGGKKQLLTYCGYDSYNEILIALMQMEEIGYDYLPF